MAAVVVAELQARKEQESEEKSPGKKQINYLTGLIIATFGKADGGYEKNHNSYNKNKANEKWRQIKTINKKGNIIMVYSLALQELIFTYL